MKITNVTVHLLKATGASRIFDLVLLPGMRRDRWKHDLVSMESGVMPVMRVETDEGIVGVCTADAGASADLTSASLEQLRFLVVGKDPLDRERLYQALHTGTRWLYQPPGWLGSFDNCLWDILGKAAGLPVYSLIGRVREKTPVYMNIRGETKEEAADDARKAVAEGFPALKDHFYHSVRENLQWFEAVRDAVGPGIEIMHDAVGIYTFEEALRVGRALDELDYRWFEEPLPERQHNKMKALCDALDVPILAPEMMMNDVDLQAQWLISGATDMIRANARHGTTAILKLAHLAEMHGSNIELNGYGGLYGLVHAHLLAAISNTSYYETFGEFRGHTERSSTEIGMLNPLDVVDGHVAPPSRPRLGRRVGLDLLQQAGSRRALAPCGFRPPLPRRERVWGEGDGWRQKTPMYLRNRSSAPLRRGRV